MAATDASNTARERVVFQIATQAVQAEMEAPQLNHLVLSAIIHPRGLGFDRAFLFFSGEHSSEIRTYLALGPPSAKAAAKREPDTSTLPLDADQLLADFEVTPAGMPETTLMRRLEGFVLPLSASAPPVGVDEQDVPIQALVAATAERQTLFYSNRVRSIYQQPPAVGGQSLVFTHLALAPIIVEDGTRGILLVDKHYSEKPLEREDAENILCMARLLGLAAMQRKLRARIEELSTLDALTGVMNRPHYYQHQNREVEQARRGGRPLSLLLFHIDRISECNDKHGHECGDHILNDVAKLIRDKVRQEDMVARWGGKVFAALLTGGATADEALRVADKLRTVIQESVLGGLPPGEVTVTVGVAHQEVDKLNSKDMLLQAEQALQKAKRQGHNQAVLWNPGDAAFE